MFCQYFFVDLSALLVAFFCKSLYHFVSSAISFKSSSIYHTGKMPAIHFHLFHAALLYPYHHSSLPNQSSGKPCSPKRNPCSMALTQCSYKTGCTIRTNGKIIIRFFARIQHDGLQGNEPVHPVYPYHR